MPCCICWPLRAKPACRLTIDDFDKINRKVPLLADLKPGGRFTAADLYAAGGTTLVAKRLLDAGILHARSTDRHRPHDRRRGQRREGERRVNRYCDRCRIRSSRRAAWSF